MTPSSSPGIEPIVLQLEAGVEAKKVVSAAPSAGAGAAAALYFQRWLGPPGWKPSPLFVWLGTTELLRSSLGGFCGILFLAAINQSVTTQSPLAFPFILGSNGAAAVLVFGLPTLKPSQPRAVIGGNLLSAIVGVTMRKLIVDIPACDSCIAVAAALAVSFSILLMHVTGTTHPPGGATALIAVIGGVEKMGYYFLLSPVLSSSISLVLVALVVNNLFNLDSPEARDGKGGYPLSWW